MPRRRTYKQKQATRRFLYNASMRSASKRRLRTALNMMPPKFTFALCSFGIAGFGQFFQGKYALGTILFLMWLISQPLKLVIVGHFTSFLLGVISMVDVLVRPGNGNLEVDDWNHLWKSQNEIDRKAREEKAEQIWNEWVRPSVNTSRTYIQSDASTNDIGRRGADDVWDQWIADAKKNNSEPSSNTKNSEPKFSRSDEIWNSWIQNAIDESKGKRTNDPID